MWRDFSARVISEEEQIPSITAQALDVAECWGSQSRGLVIKDQHTVTQFRFFRYRKIVSMDVFLNLHGSQGG